MKWESNLLITIFLITGDEQIRLRLRGRPILSVTCMITDRIGRHKILLPINQKFDKIWRKKIIIGYAFSEKQQQQQQQSTRRNARKKHAHLTRFFHLHRHEVSTVPLTVLLHCPTRSMTCTMSYIVLCLGGDDQWHSRILL